MDAKRGLGVWSYNSKGCSQGEEESGNLRGPPGVTLRIGETRDQDGRGQGQRSVVPA